MSQKTKKSKPVIAPAKPKVGKPRRGKPRVKKVQGTASDLQEAKGLANALGVKGTFPSVVAEKGDNALIKNDISVSSIKVEPAVSERSLAFTAMAIVLKAIRKGATYQEFDLWQSYMYLHDCLKKAVQGEEILGVEFPTFFWELLAALGPKKPDFKTGRIELTANVVKNDSSPYLTDYTFQYSQLALINWMMSLAPPSADTVDGFVLAQVGSPVYDEAAGAAATTKLWNFVAGSQKLYTLQAYGAPLLKDNTSAYATVVNDRGRSSTGVGAIRTTLSAETFIQSPILAKYCQEATPDDETVGPGSRRGFYHFRPSAGGAAYLGYAASEFVDRRQYHNKMIPLFKDINFFRVFDRFSILIGRIQEEALLFQTQNALPPYPLTSQQAAIMLRAVMMKICCNEGCYDIDNIEEPTVDETPFFSCSVGSSTPHLGVTVPPLFPSFFAENLRALKRRSFVIAGRNQAFGQYVVDYIPRLCDQKGVYFNQQYFWGEANTAVYVVAPGEVAINLIDAVTTFNNVPRIAILDGTELANIVDSHNKWMKEASSATTPLSSIGNEPAGAFWMLLSMTTHVGTILQLTEPEQQPQPATPVVGQTKTVARKVSEKKIRAIGYSIGRKRLGVSPGVDNVQQSMKESTLGVSSVMPTIAAVWKYQQLMLLPERKLQSGFLESTNDFYKSVMIEPSWTKASVFSQGLVNVENGMQMSEFQRAVAAANIDVKGQLAAPSEWEMDYKILQEKHAGGFFGAIATMLGNAIGVPEVGKLVKTLEHAC